MVDHLQSSTPRPKSPSMNNEEPIELAHYPNAKKPNANEVPIIERDDFPAPPVRSQINLSILSNQMILFIHTVSLH